MCIRDSLGQMQMYVNYYDRYVKQDFEKPTIGILLCKEKNDALVDCHFTVADTSLRYSCAVKLTWASWAPSSWVSLIYFIKSRRIPYISSLALLLSG